MKRKQRVYKPRRAKETIAAFTALIIKIVHFLILYCPRSKEGRRSV
jgi:hypothetical protein